MSRIEKLLKAIINNTTYDEPRLSRIEEIFYSILNSLPYNANAQSRIEALLLAIKESGLYDERTLSRIEEILKCKLDERTYTGWIGSRVEILLNEWEFSEIIEATFASFPIIIKANGEPLIDYTIYGNMSQSGTPTPDNLIQPSECGDLETSGAKAGQYKIPISSANTTTPVYLGEVETTRKIYKMRLTNPSSVTETPNGYRLEFSISSHPAPSYQLGDGICNIATWNGDYGKIGFVASNIKMYITQNIAEWATKEGATAWLDEHEVYIWYVLATEETGIVNEPLRKIGDYADTVSMEQAGVEIPTLNKPNNTVIDVETTLKPSKMYVKYNGEGTRVYITADSKLYITSNNEIYILKR